MGDDFASDSLLELYLFEATTLLDNLDLLLIDAEKEGKLTREQINEIFRIMHTIKGSSAMMAYDAVADVAHRMEDIFAVTREHGISEMLYHDLFDKTLKASKFLETEVDKIQRGSLDVGDPSQLIEELIALCNRFKEGLPEKPAPDLGRVLGGLPQRPQNKNELRSPEPITLKLIPADRDRQKSVPDIPVQPEPLSQTEEQILSNIPEAPEGGRILGMYPEYSLKTTSIIPNLDSSLFSDDSESSSSNSDSNLQTYYLHIFFNEGAKMENIRAYMLVNKLSESGIVNRVIPEDLENNPDTSESIIDHGLYISFSTNLVRGQIEALAKSTLSVESVAFVRKMPGEPDVPQPKPEPEPIAQPKLVVPPVQIVQNNVTPVPLFQEVTVPSPPSPVDAEESHRDLEIKQEKHDKPHVSQNLIPVDINKLDSLMDLVGEIVINESMVTESPDLKELPLENFRKAAHQLNKLTYELQDSVMSVRMVQLSTTFQRMFRIVRDMNKELEKVAELTLIGENTEVDKTIVDVLADPIMHLVRNAMDHAIETPQERLLAGKNAKGHIILSAQNIGSDIILSISDDGKGLDQEQILNQAAKKGLLRKSKNEYTEKEIYNFLLLPGFSTKTEVTEYSGRGVGLDVVKTQIEKIGGNITIESAKGLGTNIFLKIPLTLAIIDCMEIRLGSDTYAIPISNIHESFRASSGQIVSDPAGNEIILLRGAPYPIVRLYEAFQTEHAIRDPEEGILILADAGDRVGCLLVDELIGKFQVVVKAIPPYLQQYHVNSHGISGCTIMGTGAVSLIIDVGSLLS
ncbi:MAG: chemotaxis protein CheA [Clostridiales Family XIII bacterium]|jgi:two-component system chemotaxis sensor kinase CheA|nr:chemotaxis protein CheA [Clostridiales Family XIII bacterium]